MTPPPGRGVVDGAFRLLRALPQTVPGRQVAQLVGLTGIPRPTVHRLLAQLREAGAVHEMDGHWMLATDLLRLARHVEPYAGLRQSATDVLRALRAATGASASLIAPDGTSFVVLETVPGQMRLPVDHRPGDSVPPRTAVHPGFASYAVEVPLPTGRPVAVQIASADRRHTERFAPHVHRAAKALQRIVATRD
jgi:IclR family transcriptional regulator, acetate operon repressor